MTEVVTLRGSRSRPAVGHRPTVDHRTAGSGANNSRLASQVGSQMGGRSVGRAVNKGDRGRSTEAILEGGETVGEKLEPPLLRPFRFPLPCTGKGNTVNCTRLCSYFMMSHPIKYYKP